MLEAETITINRNTVRVEKFIPRNDNQIYIRDIGNLTREVLEGMLNKFGKVPASRRRSPTSMSSSPAPAILSRLVTSCSSARRMPRTASGSTRLTPTEWCCGSSDRLRESMRGRSSPVCSSERSPGTTIRPSSSRSWLYLHAHHP